MKEYLLNFEEWKIFFKRGGVLTIMLLISLIAFIVFWFSLGSLVVAPFYSFTTGKINPIKTYELEGKTTIMAFNDSINKLLEEGLVTNFVGVRNIIDNKYYEQVGQIDMLRVGYITLENHIARNRGTGGANNDIRQARADIHADYELPWFTSYTTKLKETIKSTNKYLAQLEKDSSIPMNDKKAVFIVNSDNLAESLDKYKQELQTTLSVKVNSFFEQNDKFYRLRGNLIALQQILIGIDIDFKEKMLDKTSYNENFIPLLKTINEAVDFNPLIVLELKGDLSKLEKETNQIVQRLAELRDKLKNG